MSENNFELQDGVQDAAPLTQTSERNTNSSSQPDGGWAANMILASCAVLQFPTWGQHQRN
jgi:hypothetical protein